MQASMPTNFFSSAATGQAREKKKAVITVAINGKRIDFS
jgi:hypothetical protein